MSYILDALRRADAERGRGGVPGLHTQATPVPGASPAQRSSASASLTVVVAAVLVVAALAAGGTWWAMQRNAPSRGVVLAGAQPPSTPSTPAAPVTAPPPTQTVTPATSASPAPANPGPAAAAVPAPPPAVAAEPRPAERRAVPPPREKPAATVAAQRAPLAEPPRNRSVDEAPRDRTPPAAPPVARTQEPAAAPAPTGTVFAQSDLPDAVRTQLPVLKISGATYSANPMHRMAIVNGQVLHEGDVAAPGLLLEKIEPTRTIWSFKGYRYGLASQ